MEILSEYGREEVAKVYIGSFRHGGNHIVEFVESLQPPIPRSEKWVLIVSSSFGCPMKCLMCDAGGKYHGRMETEEILAQIDFMIGRRFPDRKVPVKKFKVQFARMGEPSLNPSVLEALIMMRQRYDAPGMMACVSTIAPERSDGFFDKLIDVKNENYSNGQFQIQFSIHTTDDSKRDWLIPGKKWSLNRISDFGEKFYEKGDRRVALNFALTQGLPVDSEIIAEHFDPEKFCIKLTPLNPTIKAELNKLVSALDPENPQSVEDVINGFESHGFEVILSIGELEENKIGSNCGQYVSLLNSLGTSAKGGYETSRYRIS